MPRPPEYIRVGGNGSYCSPNGFKHVTNPFVPDNLGRCYERSQRAGWWCGKRYKAGNWQPLSLSASQMTPQRPLKVTKNVTSRYWRFPKGWLIREKNPKKPPYGKSARKPESLTPSPPNSPTLNL